MMMDGWQTENYMKRLERDNVVQAIPIIEGMRIYFRDAKSYYEAKKTLYDAGYKIKPEDMDYMIYVLSVPYEYNETVYRIK